MSSVLPFDIIAIIIDIVGENKDTNLLKELALVSHSFLQICTKHLFATVELHDAVPKRRVASSKNLKGFIKLLTIRPDVVKYIRKLTYKGYYHPTYPSFNTDDHLLSPILRTISRLNCLTITIVPSSSSLNWDTLDSSLKSAFLHLMHLPTINHINLLCIENFPLSSLTPSINLLRLDIFYLSFVDGLEEDGSPEIVVQSEMMPKIRDFHSSFSSLMTKKLLHAKRQDGRPAFNFMGLRRLWISFNVFEDNNVRYLLQIAKLLEELHLIVNLGRSIVGLLSLSAPRTLKLLDLTVFLYDVSVSLLLAGLCEELEAMAGHNMLEVLSLKVFVDGYGTEDFIGPIIQDVEKELVKPGWSALRRVSIKLSISGEDGEKLSETLQSLPDKYLSHLSNLESVTFNFSVE
jgi:hypothetical protein